MHSASDDTSRVASSRASPPLLYHASHGDGASSQSAIHRLRALAALSGSLTDTLSPEDAATLIEKEALSALDASSAIVVTLGEFPLRSPALSLSTASLTLLHAIGVPEEVRA